MCQAMQRYRLGNSGATVSGLSQSGRKKIEELFLSITDEDGEVRHQKWLEKIGNGYFDFTPVKLEYIAKGYNSWKQQALGTTKLTDKATETFTYSDSFLKSNWKMFHDALLAHHFFVIHDLLPNYGICVA
jgi:hypothetical protein